jgi:hypothetical protein
MPAGTNGFCAGGFRLKRALFCPVFEWFYADLIFPFSAARFLP